MKHREGSKISIVRNHFLRGLPLTQLQSIGLYSVFRLASDVEKLRGGMNIITTLKTDPNGAKYAEYSVPKVGMKLRHQFAAYRGEGKVVNTRDNGRSFVVEWSSGEYSTYFPDTQASVIGVA